MKKLLLIFLFIIYSFKIHSQTYQPLNIDGFNADVIANGLGSAQSSTTEDLDGVHYCIRSIDWKFNEQSPSHTNGLPINRIIYSAVTPGLTYQLQNYSNNNSIRIENTATQTTSLVQGIVKANKLFV